MSVSAFVATGEGGGARRLVDRAEQRIVAIERVVVVAEGVADRQLMPATQESTSTHRVAGNSRTSMPEYIDGA